MVWRCAECGKIHETENPPCLDCGHDEFVPVNQSTPDDATVREEFVWACPNCGRQHQRNSPPCRRCGHTSFEKRDPDYDDVGPSGGTSYLDVLEPKYALGYLAVAALAVLVVLSLTGVVSVPFISGPSPPGAPGDAETYANVSLQAVEDAYVDAVNSRRSTVDVGPLSVQSNLDDAATAINQRRVRAAVDGEAGPDVRDILGRYEPSCPGEINLDTSTDDASQRFGNDGTTASAVAGSLGIAPSDAQGSLFDEQFERVSVDVHVGPDGTVYATVLVC